MNPDLTIVCDVDDTLCFTVERDYANSTPNLPVIAKLQEAHQKGYRIVLHTARGQGRSQGLIASVAGEVILEIESLCYRFSIPYDQIVVGKEWAKWYVDDRALRPDEFTKVEL